MIALTIAAAAAFVLSLLGLAMVKPRRLTASEIAREREAAWKNDTHDVYRYQFGKGPWPVECECVGCVICREAKARAAKERQA